MEDRRRPDGGQTPGEAFPRNQPGSGLDKTQSHKAAGEISHRLVLPHRPDGSQPLKGQDTDPLRTVQNKTPAQIIGCRLQSWGGLRQSFVCPVSCRTYLSKSLGPQILQVVTLQCMTWVLELGGACARDRIVVVSPP